MFEKRDQLLIGGNYEIEIASKSDFPHLLEKRNKRNSRGKRWFVDILPCPNVFSTSTGSIPVTPDVLLSFDPRKTISKAHQFFCLLLMITVFFRRD
jgi:hypothetical protein